MVRKYVIAIGLALVGFAAACQLVAGIERTDKIDSTTSTDGGDADAPFVDPDPCNHARRPEIPAQDDDAGANPPGIIYLAISQTKLLAPAANGSPAGFDLDGVCTCDTRPLTAEGGAPSCTGKQQACDDDGGVDNGSARLFQSFATPGLDFDDAAGVNQSISQGTRGIILALSDYNGEANDRSVQVGLLLSYGILDPSGCMNPKGDTADHYKPVYCGKDKWTYDSAQALAGPNGILQPVISGKGWVTNHTLVFEGQVNFKLFFGDAVLGFSQPTQVGLLTKVDKAGGSFWHLEGTLAGRIPTTDLLVASATLKIPSSTQRFCDQPALFMSVRDQICAATDIAKGPEFDFQGGACDAISSAITFTAEESTLGQGLAAPDGGAPCGDAGASLYSCN